MHFARMLLKKGFRLAIGQPKFVIGNIHTEVSMSRCRQILWLSGFLPLLLFVFAFVNSPVNAQSAPDDSQWIELFNGKDLEGWTPKIRNYKLGENYADTFRVEDGVIKVSYDKYDGPFKGRFGHLFYDKPFSDYILELEYRFTGQQMEGGAKWAFRNSGVMLHGQNPETMDVDQQFPVSIEAQFLGSVEGNLRSTLNLCTPGTHIRIHGKLHKPHVIKSRSKFFMNDEWVKCQIEVRGKTIRHYVAGQVVMEYHNPQFDKNDKKAKPLIKDGKVSIESGTISLQSESHPVEFRNIRLKDLSKNE